ncbi:MAG TPA: phytoene/squalene synthase family protein [Rhizomicrobium sp.]|nr:phytoene/squalene synthase family protein [Rhizomicrobium sp.]
MTTESLAACEAIVRQADPDRFISALFAPARKRPLLFALYAFNHELAHIGESVREPMMGEIRLQWWREAMESARAGKPRPHDVARALAEVFAAADLPDELFEAMIAARAFDLGNAPFVALDALEAYADATSGNLMRLAARILGDGGRHDDLASEAGIAVALGGILRAIPFHASRRRLFLPSDLLSESDIEEAFAGRESANLKAAVGIVATRAREHLAKARRMPKPGAALAAFLPAALVPGYIRLVTKPAFDPFKTPAEIPLYRRQIALMGASLRGRV